MKTAKLSRWAKASLARFENSTLSDGIALVSLRCPARSAERIRAYARRNRKRVAEVVDNAITAYLGGAK